MLRAILCRESADCEENRTPEAKLADPVVLGSPSRSPNTLDGIEAAAKSSGKESKKAEGATKLASDLNI